MNAHGTIFMSGASGHTGSRLATRLLEHGWSLRCLLRTAAHRTYLPEHPNLRIIGGNLNQPGPWTDELASCEAAIHAAHIGMIAPLVEAARTAGVPRILAMSSTRQFTRFPDPAVARLKAGEQAVMASGMTWTILRPTMIFGGPRDKNIEKLVAWLRRRSWVPSLLAGRNLVQPIFVWDLVEAFINALNHPERTGGRALVLAGPEPMTQRAMIETIARQMNRPLRVVPVPYPVLIAGAAVAARLMPRRSFGPAAIRRTLEDKAFDITEALEALEGWQPRPFEEAIRLKLEGRA